MELPWFLLHKYPLTICMEATGLAENVIEADFSKACSVSVSFKQTANTRTREVDNKLCKHQWTGKAMVRDTKLSRQLVTGDIPQLLTLGKTV